MSHNTCDVNLTRPINSVGFVDSEAARFWASVRKERHDVCWLWQGPRLPKGYGRVTRAGSRTAVYAHRVAWELTHGPIPAGLSVLHHCDTPACVNPSHLYVGTQADNMRDAQRRGRLHRPRPRRQQVTDGQIAEMKALRQSGLTLVAIADRYGVSKSFVSLVVRGQRRQHQAA